MSSHLQATDPRGLGDFLMQIVLMQLPWFALWAGSNVFFYRSRFLNQDSRNHCVALVYSLWALYFASTTLFCGKRHLEGPNTVHENNFLVFSLSYLIYDLVICSIYRHLTINSLANYFFGSVSVFVVLHNGYGASFLLYGTLIIETPFTLLHIRKILGNMKKRHTILYEVCLLAYMATFLVGRGIFGTLFNLYLSSHSSLVPRGFLMASVLHLFESLTHFRAQLMIFRDCVDHRNKRIENQVSLWWWSVNPAIKKLDYYKHMKQKVAERREKDA
jgi:hypothetical protein